MSLNRSFGHWVPRPDQQALTPSRLSSEAAPSCFSADPGIHRGRGLPASLSCPPTPITTMKSLGIWNVPREMRDLLLGLCLTGSERRRLAMGCTGEDRGPAATPEATYRLRLLGACSVESTVARRVTDLLDLRYVDLAQFLHGLEPEVVKQELEAAIARGIDRDLSAYLWCLATDPRHSVRALGRTLHVEALTCAYGILQEVAEFASGHDIGGDRLPPNCRCKKTA